MNDFRELNQKFGRYIYHQGQQYLYFSGTAYLGLSSHKRFISHYQKGIKKFGLNNGTSRKNNIQLGIYDAAENYAANYFGAESCAIVSSGYLASHVAVKALQNENLMFAPHTHPSLWLNGNPNQYADFKIWLAEAVLAINQSNQKEWVLVSNAMNNLYPEIYDFSPLHDINPEKKITLILDDSHGIGLNNGGKSALSAAPNQQNIEVVVVASMAKALGVDAGIILSSSKMIKRIKESDIFVGASPPAAAGLYAFMQSKNIYYEQLAALQENVSHIVKSLTEEDWHFEKGFPVFLTQNTDIYRRLEAQNILISAFSYPDKNSKTIHRIVLSSWHKKSDVNKLVKALQS